MFFCIIEGFFLCSLEGANVYTVIAACDEYAYRIPNPKHMPKYTLAKVPHTQDKTHTTEQLHRALLLPLPPYKKLGCH